MPKIANQKYAKVKSRLVARGKTLRSWAMEHRFPIGSVYNSVRGLRNGPRSARIRQKLEETLNG